MNELLVAQGVGKTFGAVEALRDVTLGIKPADFLAIMGRSGSGKSTLLHVLAGLEAPSRGRISYAGADLSALSEDGLALWRRAHVGLVFQAFHLIPTLTALENVAFPLYPTGLSAQQRRERAQARLTQVGLGHRLGHRPTQLSGGEQQRVAIARALVNQPALILADEPTGNLDTENGAQVLDLFRELNQREGVAIILITHDPGVAAQTDRTVVMRDGRLEADAAPVLSGDLDVRATIGTQR